MSWEEEERRLRMTRREWVRMGMAAGTVGALGAAFAGMAGQLLPPPIIRPGALRETIHYTRFPSPQWWNGFDGRPVRVTDFEEWQGATGVWRGLFLEGELLPGTGLPVLIIRVKRDTDAFQEPAPETLPGPLPEGFSLYYDDADRDIRILVCFDRCVHLCCFPGWHVVSNPPPLRDYQNFVLAGENPVEENPTWYKYRLDPIYCVCHGSQYEPMNLVVDVNPKNGAPYVGAKRVHGPASRSLPIVPMRTQGDILIGGMPEKDGKPDPRWYVYC